MYWVFSYYKYSKTESVMAIVFFALLKVLRSQLVVPLGAMCPLGQAQAANAVIGAGVSHPEYSSSQPQRYPAERPVA